MTYKQTLAALSDPTRRAVFERVIKAPRSVGEIARGLPISRPAVSRHLRLLRSAGLVSETPEGTRRIYRLQDEGVDAVRRYLEQVWGDVATRSALTTEHVRPSPRGRGGR